MRASSLLCSFIVILSLLVSSPLSNQTSERQIPSAPMRVDGNAARPMSNFSDNPAYLENFSLTAAFEGKMQMPGGGIDESEDIHYINTDNTLEAIWIWSRYYTLTRDNRYYANISAAWEYAWANPAWLESDSGKVYSCAWALKAELEFRKAYGNRSQIAYANRCATYILNRNGLDPLMGLRDWGRNDIRGLAAGNLYDWALEQGNDTARRGAIALGNATKAAIELNSTWLAVEDWALAGGVAYWGVVHSTFREYPDAAWADQYVAYLKDNVTTPGGGAGNSQCGWYAWYSLGHYAAWQATGNSTYLNESLGMLAWLIFQDGDRDGGIPTNFGDPDNEDESWVTSYRSLVIGEILPAWHGQPPDPPVLTSAFLTGGMSQNLSVLWNKSIQDSTYGDVVRYDIYRGTVYDASGAGYLLHGNMFAGSPGFQLPIPVDDPSSYFFYAVAVDSEWLTSGMSSQAGRIVEYNTGIGSHALLGNPFIVEDDSVDEILVWPPFEYVRAFDPSRSGSPWISHLPGRQHQGLDRIPLGTGFWAGTGSPFGVPMAGLVPETATIQLKAGWNLVASCSMNDRTVADVLGGVPWIAAEVLDESQPGYYLRRAQSTDYLFPGQGFWVQVTADSTLAFFN